MKKSEVYRKMRVLWGDLGAAEQDRADTLCAGGAFFLGAVNGYPVIAEKQYVPSVYKRDGGSWKGQGCVQYNYNSPGVGVLLVEAGRRLLACGIVPKHSPYIRESLEAAIRAFEAKYGK